MKKEKKGFAWEDFWITDSTMDETGRFPVSKDYYTKGPIHFTIGLFNGDITGHDGILGDLQELLDYQETVWVEYELDGQIIKIEV